MSVLLDTNILTRSVQGLIYACGSNHCTPFSSKRKYAERIHQPVSSWYIYLNNSKRVKATYTEDVKASGPNEFSALNLSR